MTTSAARAASALVATLHGGAAKNAVQFLACAGSPRSIAGPNDDAIAGMTETQRNRASLAPGTADNRYHSRFRVHSTSSIVKTRSGKLADFR